MKRIICFVLLASVFCALCSCSKTNISDKADMTLTFINERNNISVTLSEEEAQKVIAILDGKSYDSLASGIPSCGFSKNISLKVGGRIYAIACDTCNYIQDLGNLRYFSVSQEDMAYIHALFKKYGGHFPCI